MSQYQGGTFVELLTPQGQNPLANWKIANGKQTAVQKVYDKDIKGYLFSCTGGGGVRLQIPKDDAGGSVGSKATTHASSLGLVHPFLVLQVFIPQGPQPFILELGVMDSSGVRRRVIVSSSFSELKSTALHGQVPFAPASKDAWVNLVIPLSDLIPLLFKGKPHHPLLTLPSPTCIFLVQLTLSSSPSHLQTQEQPSGASTPYLWAASFGSVASSP
jgi:hypothetical protein